MPVRVLGRIQPKHMEEMKCDHFCEGLNPEYWQMLAHKVDGENPAGYSDLFLAKWKLERRAEARDSLPPKTVVTSGSNAIHSQTPGNVFPNCRECIPLMQAEGQLYFHYLSCNHWKWCRWSRLQCEAGRRRRDVELLADDEVEVSGGAGGTGELKEYIICFTKTVKLYQQKNRSCFGYRIPDHLMWDCPKDISKSAEKADLNIKEGMAKKGGQAPQKPAVTQWASLEETPQT